MTDPLAAVIAEMRSHTAIDLVDSERGGFTSITQVEKWADRLSKLTALRDALAGGARIVPEGLINALRNWSGHEPSQSVLAREVESWLAAAPSMLPKD